jgi:hypothetical protein
MNRWILLAVVLAVEPLLGAESSTGKSNRTSASKIFGGASSAAKPSGSGKAPKYEPLPFTITLPSGTELTQALMVLPEKWMDTLFPQEALVYVEKFPSDKVRGGYTFSQGKLNGPSAVLYEDGSLAMLANYEMSEREGPLRHWDEEKRRLLYADYKHDKKHGLVCLFHEDWPWFIQECDTGNVSAEYLVKWNEGKAEVLARDRLQPDDLREMVTARTTLTKLESQLAKSESELKKSLRDWFQEKDKEIKRQRVTRQSAARRDEQRKKEDAAQKSLQLRLRSALRASTGR